MVVDVDIENLVCQRGDLVRVGHDQLLASQVARITKVVGRNLHLDSIFDPRGDIATPLEYDFRSGTMPAGLTFFRNSTATIWNGTRWDQAASGAPRFQNGLFIEGPRTNLIKNPRGEGVVIPATLPTGWNIPTPRGLSVEVIGKFPMDGVDLVRLRIHGTADATGFFNLQFNTDTEGAVTGGEDVSVSLFVRAQSGDVPTDLNLRLALRGAANAWIGNQAWAKVDATGILTRYEGSKAVPADAATAIMILGFTPQVGQSYDFEIEVGWPQFEKGKFTTTPILPPAGTLVAQNRTADRLTLALNSIQVPANGRCTVAVQAKVRARADTDQVLFQIDDGTDNNRYTIWDRVLADFMDLEICNAGVTTRVPISVFDVSKVTKVELAIDGAGTAIASVDDGEEVRLGGGPTAGLTTLRISDPASAIPGARAYATFEVVTVTPGTIPKEAFGIQLRTANGAVLPPRFIQSTVADDVIEVDADTASRAAPGDMLAIGKINGTLTDWLVEAVTPGNDLSASLKLIEYAPAVNRADSGPIPSYLPPNSDTGAGIYLGPVRDLHGFASVEYVDRQQVNAVKVDWNPPAGYLTSYYLIERIYADDTKILLKRTTDTFILDQIPALGIPAGGLPAQYFVTPVTRRGLRGVTTSVTVTVLPDQTIPDAPKLTANVLGNSTRLLWTIPDAPDVVAYQLRWTSDFGLLEWNQMQILIESVAGTTNTMMVHTRSGVYAIRAVDAAGNWSDVSYVRTMVESLPPVDASYTLDGPPWTGTLSDVELDAGGNLVLSKLPTGLYAPIGYFEFATPLALAKTWKVRVETDIVMDVFPDPGDLHVTHDAQIYIAAAKSLPKLKDPWFKPLATAKPLSGAPTNFNDWTPVIAEWLEGLLFWTRVYLFSRDGIHTPVVKKAHVDIFFDPRVESGSDVPATGGVLEVNYRYPFVQTPSLQITLNNGDRDDFITRVRSDNTGFRVEIRSGNNQLVPNRNIDWLASGIGIGP
jgi:hypothetical protein